MLHRGEWDWICKGPEVKYSCIEGLNNFPWSGSGSNLPATQGIRNPVLQKRSRAFWLNGRLVPGKLSESRQGSLQRSPQYFITAKVKYCCGAKGKWNPKYKQAAGMLCKVSVRQMSLSVQCFWRSAVCFPVRFKISEVSRYFLSNCDKYVFRPWSG